MERLIRVTGKAKIFVQPDTVALNITLVSRDMSYSTAAEKSAADTSELKNAFTEIGIAKDKVKTVSFGLDTETEGYHDEHGNWKNRFIGYKAVHDLKMEFDVDSDMLTRAIEAMIPLSCKPEFDIEYTVKRAGDVKDKLIADAVRDSKKKAAVLTKAADAKLGELVSIDYSWGELEIRSAPMSRNMSSDSVSFEGLFKSFTPDEIAVEDSVTVTWKII